MKYYIIILALSLTLLGCNKENMDNPNLENDRMHIEALHPSTKANDTSFEMGDKIGVYATEYIDGMPSPLQISGNWINNSYATYDGNEWVSGKNLYWSSNPIDVYGYYPYIPEMLSSIEKHKWSVQLDQSTTEGENCLSGYEASDFLWAKADCVSYNDETVKLHFRHLCSKMVVRLVRGEDFTDDIPDDTEVFIYSTVPSALINLTKGIISKDPYGEPEKIKACRVDQDLFQAIVVPQSILEYSPFIEIVMGEVSYMIEDIFTYHAGKEYVVSITLDKSPSKIKIEIDSSISGWN